MTRIEPVSPNAIAREHYREPPNFFLDGGPIHRVNQALTSGVWSWTRQEEGLLFLFEENKYTLGQRKRRLTVSEVAEVARHFRAVGWLVVEVSEQPMQLLFRLPADSTEDVPEDK